MTRLQDKVGVITGAASGIGLAMAHRFGREGMRLAIADIEADALEAAAEELEAADVRAIPMLVDVADGGSMEALGARVKDELGAVDLLCLNAGVSGGGGPLETLTTADWAWGIDVNLWGVIHGLRVFLGEMKQRNEGHVVLTSSIAGIINSPQAGPYHATKHAVASIAEVLFRELEADGSAVTAHCLCPGLVSTNFPSGDRNRPASLKNSDAAEVPAEAREAMQSAVLEIFARGATAAHVADCVHDAIQANRFWIYTDDVHEEAIAARHRAIESATPPPTTFGALDGY